MLPHLQQQVEASAPTRVIVQPRAGTIDRDQLREQIRAQVEQATANARQAAAEASRAAQAAGGAAAGVPQPPDAPLPPGEVVFTTTAPPAPWEMDIPPNAKDVAVGFFVMVAAIFIAMPLMRAIGRRIERGAPPPVRIPPEVTGQLQHLSQAVDAIAIEVERISEGQRFATRLLSEKKDQSALP